MKVYERAVRFEDVDVVGIVFFANFLHYAHEAMEHFFGDAEGGYHGLILRRRVGFPTVRVDAEYLAPLRYGDVVRIETSSARIGTRSAVLRYRFVRAGDGRLAADVRHTVVCTDLDALASCEMPADVRSVLEAHLEAPGSAP